MLLIFFSKYTNYWQKGGETGAEEGKSCLNFASLGPLALPLSFREVSPLAPHTRSRSTATQQKKRKREFGPRRPEKNSHVIRSAIRYPSKPGEI